jgi:hypothetical protein
MADGIMALSEYRRGDAMLVTIILRGVSLLEINSASLPRELRLAIWSHLAASP